MDPTSRCETWDRRGMPQRCKQVVRKKRQSNLNVSQDMSELRCACEQLGSSTSCSCLFSDSTMMLSRLGKTPCPFFFQWHIGGRFVMLLRRRRLRCHARMFFASVHPSRNLNDPIRAMPTNSNSSKFYCSTVCHVDLCCLRSPYPSPA